jgi:hypothetical protein
MSLILQDVIPTDEQINLLYDHLLRRTHRISHKEYSTIEDHRHFVINHPYRAWFIVKESSIVLGSVYVQFDNSIGLNCSDETTEFQINEVLREILSKLTPLDAKPSVRYGGYFLNVSSSNVILQNKLSNLGFAETQRTYILDKETMQNTRKKVNDHN